MFFFDLNCLVFPYFFTGIEYVDKKKTMISMLIIFIVCLKARCTEMVK